MQQLGFAWDEVHDMAEDLEHINHSALIDRLDDFLGNPEFDPHGDPIPDKQGNIRYHEDINLSELAIGEQGVIVAGDRAQSGISPISGQGRFDTANPGGSCRN